MGDIDIFVYDYCYHDYYFKCILTENYISTNTCTYVKLSVIAKFVMIIAIIAPHDYY